jgi:nitrogen fixation NifU-like protein
MLDDIYSEIIRDHYARPRNRGKVDPADMSARDSNPLCGDDVEITARLTDGKIAEIKFGGKACAICTASTSIMTQKLIGKTLPEARQLIGGFLNMMRGETPFGGKEMGDLKALEGVLMYPVRVKCATLAWNTTLRGLPQSHDEKS